MALLKFFVFNYIFSFPLFLSKKRTNCLSCPNIVVNTRLQRRHTEIKSTEHAYPMGGAYPRAPPPPVLPWCPFVEYEHLQLKRQLGAVGLNLGSDEISGHAPQLLRDIGILIAGSLVFMAKNEDGS